MNQEMLITKRLVLTTAGVMAGSYMLTVIIFGVIWDPNGAILLERSWKDSLRIIWIGFYMCLPMGISTFSFSHPVSAVLGLGHIAFAVIGLSNLKTVVGRSIIYTLSSLLVVLGTVKFFLMA